MSCQTNNFDLVDNWTIDIQVQDIESIVNNLHRKINTADLPLGLIIDQKHEVIMSEIYKAFLNGSITNNKECKEIVETIKRKVKPKQSLKYGHLSYYYDIGINNGIYENNDKLRDILRCNLIRENSGVMVYSIFTSAYPKIKKEIITNNSDTVDYSEEYVFSILRSNDSSGKFSCKHDCAFCPNEPGQPRSYLTKEPGVARATNNDHDPIRQFIARSKQYISQGHPINKCEVIIQGGTWNSYPKEYCEQFIRDIFYTANNLYKIFMFEIEFRKKYNINNLSKNDEIKMLKEYYHVCPPKSLNEEIKINEKTIVRIIGLTPETRPDQITAENLIDLRSYGATRLQLGIQHINDNILNYVKRGCHFKHTIHAIKSLKDCGFKVDGHWMPDLPNPDESTYDMVEEDKKMFDAINNDQRLKLDQIKIYPCMTVPYSQVLSWYESGKYKPYGENISRPDNYNKLNKIETIEFRMQNQLYKNISEFLKVIHPSIRINRIIRDIPSEYIMGGTSDSGMRSQLEHDLDYIGTKCMCIRCREVQYYQNKKKHIGKPKINILPYIASDALEFFISIESDTGDTENMTLNESYRNKVIHSFLRLRLSNTVGKIIDIKTKKEEIVFPELVKTALIRELHTYGQVQNVNSLNHTSNSSQHKGYGKQLMKIAEYIAYEFGYRRIGVIAGVGVREYYHKLGYLDEGIGNYQIKTIINKPITNLDGFNKLFIDMLNEDEIIYGILTDYKIEENYKYAKKITRWVEALESLLLQIEPYVKYKKVFLNHYSIIFVILLIIAIIIELFY